MLRFNSVKIFMDGISANQSASYKEPYLGSNTATEPMLTAEELTELLLQLHEEKLDLRVHSIGDLATQKTARQDIDAKNATKSMT